MSRLNQQTISVDLSAYQLRFNILLKNKSSQAGAGTVCKGICALKDGGPLDSMFLKNSNDASIFYRGYPSNYEVNQDNVWGPALHVETEESMLNKVLSEMMGGTILQYNSEDNNLDSADFQVSMAVSSFLAFYKEENGEVVCISEDEADDILSDVKARSFYDGAYILFEDIDSIIQKDGEGFYEARVSKPVLVLYKQKALLSSSSLLAGVKRGSTSSRPAFKPMSKETKALKSSSRQEKKDRYRSARSHGQTNSNGNTVVGNTTTPTVSSEEENMMM